MQVLVVSGQVVVQVGIRLGWGFGTTSCLFAVRFEYSFDYEAMQVRGCVQSGSSTSARLFRVR